MAELTGSILTLSDRVRETTARVVDQVLGAEAAALVDAARRQWPVKTGRSKAALGYTATAGRVTITDTAPYTRVIISDGGVRPWDAYVLTPMSALIRKTAPHKIGAALMETLRE